MPVQLASPPKQNISVVKFLFEISKKLVLYLIEHCPGTVCMSAVAALVFVSSGWNGAWDKACGLGESVAVGIIRTMPNVKGYQAERRAAEEGRKKSGPASTTPQDRGAVAMGAAQEAGTIYLRFMREILKLGVAATGWVLGPEQRDDLSTFGATSPGAESLEKTIKGFGEAGRNDKAVQGVVNSKSEVESFQRRQLEIYLRNAARDFSGQPNPLTPAVVPERESNPAPSGGLRPRDPYSLSRPDSERQAVSPKKPASELTPNLSPKTAEFLAKDPLGLHKSGNKKKNSGTVEQYPSSKTKAKHQPLIWHW